MSEIGINRDVVTLTVSGNTVLQAETYDIQQNALTIPAVFAITLGHSAAVSDIIQQTAPNEEFELKIDGRTQFRGRIDGHSSRGDGNGGATVTIHGRDRLAALHDSFIENEKCYNDVTYVELVQKELELAMPGETVQLGYDNNANRQAVTGALARKSSKTSVERVTTLVGSGGPDQAATQNTIQSKIGTKRYEGLIKPELDRGGLFLQHLADDTFLVSSPDTSQASSYSLIRKRDNPAVNNILSHDFKHDTVPRFGACIVHFRNGGGDEPRTRAFGLAEDFEIGQVLGFKKKLVVQDHKCKSLTQADYLAKRKIAESRRHGWSLTYTVAGHTTIGKSGEPMVWAIDTVVDVDDDVLNIHSAFYIEGVTFKANPQKTTELHLMRLEDLLFGDPEHGPQTTQPSDTSATAPATPGTAGAATVAAGAGDVAAGAAALFGK